MTSPPHARSPENLLGLDYREEARKLQQRGRIVDIHCHLGGPDSARVYQQAARLYGVEQSYSMTPLTQAQGVKEALGDTVRFIAVPRWNDPDKRRAWGEGFLEDIQAFHDRFQSRMIKLWNAPRVREIFPGASGEDVIQFDSPWRIAALELAGRLGMMTMVHVADPDTWFATKYADAAAYGTKKSQYDSLRRILDRFSDRPFVAAHMGGSPENLSFLDDLLARHANLYLDTSATKWMVRELSRHPPGQVAAFFEKWAGRVLFGSDIVTTEDHLRSDKVGIEHPKALQAASEAQAFDLYASRFWALRTLLETDYQDASPIADSDLMMVEPGKFNESSSPTLRGCWLPSTVLDMVYESNARDLLGSWESGNWRPGSGI